MAAYERDEVGTLTHTEQPSRVDPPRCGSWRSTVHLRNAALGRLLARKPVKFGHPDDHDAAGKRLAAA
jgi:hypothetical protein